MPVAAQENSQIASRYQSGADLQTVVTLLQEEALNEQGQANSLSSERAYREQIVAQEVGGKGRDPRTVEYEVVRKLLDKHGTRGDTLLVGEALKRSRDREQAPLTVTSVAPGISQIRMPTIGVGAASQVSQALHEVPYNRGIILDLRGSTGDDPQTIADIARLFFPQSAKALVKTVGTRNRVRNFESAGRPIALDIPVVVLVDKTTREGAEALAAQLTQTGRAQLIGSQTAGADLYAETFALPSGAAVRIVTGHWRTGDGRAFKGGLEAIEANAADPVARAVELLASRPAEPRRPTIFPAKSQIGDYQLGFNAGTGDLGIPGSFEYFRAGESGLRPKDELKVWFVPDFIVFNYKPPSSLLNYFADRIYSFASDAATDKGIRLGSNYNDVIAAYGEPGQNGYNESYPFPAKSRGNRQDRYYVNYDALGVSFGLEVGTNLVKEIGIYKPGS